MENKENAFYEQFEGHIVENLADDAVRQALQSGQDLRNYSQDVEQQLDALQKLTIQDYLNEAVNIASLHKQIKNCDSILESMEGMLQDFQADLGNISSEIQSLQQQSVEMNVKLKNRQAVRGELSQFVDEMAVPEQMISHILETPVTERQFLEQLHELNHKINFVKEQSFKDAKSCGDVRDILEKLKLKAISKIRDFLMQKVLSFRKPMANYQNAQNTMLKFRFFNEFLMNNERNVAKELCDEYVDTTSKIYYSYFKTYYGKLMRLQLDVATEKDDLMGADEGAKRSLFASRSALKNKSTVFTLGQRAVVLDSDLEVAVIVPHTAQTTGQKFPFESLFRSLHYALLDNCCREYLFVCDFYMLSGTQAQNLFNAIMGKTLAMLQKELSGYVTECHDAIALFLCMHIVSRYRSLMIRRQVTALDNYWGMLCELMWPRFSLIVEHNISSVSHCDPSKFGHIDVRPHFVTRRYAEFTSALLTIAELGRRDASSHQLTVPDSTTTANQLPLFANLEPQFKQLLTKLRQEMERFLLRLAGEFRHSRERLICLINNYDMALIVISECVREESAADWLGFKDLLNQKIVEFVEELLTEHFGLLVNFVKEAESAIDRGVTDYLKNDETRVAHVIRDFSSEWKRSVENLNQQIVVSFTNFKNGTQVFQTALAQLIQYYTRLGKVMTLPPFKHMSCRNDIISIHNLMVEIKKLKPAF